MIKKIPTICIFLRAKTILFFSKKLFIIQIFASRPKLSDKIYMKVYLQQRKKNCLPKKKTLEILLSLHCFEFCF